MRFRMVSLMAVSLCLGIDLPLAGAQYARTLDYLINRPGLYGPSTHVGVIGGRYTNESYGPLTSTRQDVSLFGQGQFQFRGRRGGRSHAGHMPAGVLGLQAGLSRPGDVSFYGGGGGLGSTSVAGLVPTTALFLPDPSTPIRFVPSLAAHQYTPRSPATRVQALLGLTPVRPEPEGPLLDDAETRLNTRTEKRVELARRDALELFKQATVEMRDPRTDEYTNCVDCPDKLAQALQRLKMVRILDAQTGLPALLMAHAALEQEQPTLAVRYLLEARERDPQLFAATAPPLDPYFGDAPASDGQSAVLAAQMWRYWRIGEVNPDAPEAMVLQAYCAWRARDYARVREAAERVEAAALTEPKLSRDLLDFAVALREATP